MDLDKVNWKPLERIIIKNINNSLEELKISTLTGNRKKPIPIHVDDFEGFKTSLEERTVDVVEIARELELEMGTWRNGSWIASILW